MGWSLRIVRAFGIDVFIHWSFFLLVAVMAGGELFSDKPGPERLKAAGMSALFVLSVFFCVVLHEFGHALTARAFKVKTKDILVLPIGGVARLERLPKNPMQEFAIAIAGPAVNVAIALVLGATLVVKFGVEMVMDRGSYTPSTGGLTGYLMSILAANVMLVVFNLIPAFPMDGGRILRALLASMVPHVQATRIAARVGQGIAVVFALLAIYLGHPMLIVLAFFVFMGAAGELNASKISSALEGLKVGQAMLREFFTLRRHDPILLAEEVVRAGAQSDVPVVEGGSEPDSSVLVGLIRRPTLLETLGARQGYREAGTLAVRDIPTAVASDDLEATVDRMRKAGLGAIPVVEAHGNIAPACEGSPTGTQSRGPRLVGLLTLGAINSLIEMRSTHADRSPTARSVAGSVHEARTPS